jgi:sugar lactone lactonase YvrE
VTDAAGNDLLRIAPNGSISTLAVFPQRFVEYPPGSGTQVLMDAVPTTVAVGPDGALYVGELTGFPYPVGGARIYRVVPGDAPQVYADGFTNVIDIAFDHDGSLLVLELAKNSLLSDDQTGALIRLHPDGSRETLISEGLMMPTAVAIGADGALYISNCGACAGTGQVIRLELD